MQGLHKTVFAKAPAMGKIWRDFGHAFSFASSSSRGIYPSPSYLIYTGRAYGQAYGYVFDTDGNVVTEGEHFGYTIEDARKKIDEQKIYNEVRFGVNSF